jgi:hypothetical protein
MALPHSRHLLVCMAVVLPACSDAVGPRAEPPSSSPCARVPSLIADSVPGCLARADIISSRQYSSARALFDSAGQLRDSLRADTATASFIAASYLTRALRDIAEYYRRGVFDDSSRFARVVDHVGVTMDYVRGDAVWRNGVLYFERTPGLVWRYYPDRGFFQQPVETVQSVLVVWPSATVSTDSLRKRAEALVRYAVRRGIHGRSFPVYEYYFDWTSGGISEPAPWRSSMAQGLVMELYTEMYKRTGEEQWRERARDIRTSYEVTWDEGGIMLNDTSHGYWFEEFSPDTWIWNGSAQALIGLGFYADATGDVTARRLFARGLEAMRHYTADYDTGRWTLYSRVQGLNTRSYHALHVRLADVLYEQSGDVYFQDTAARWRSYTAPAGVR